MVTNRNPIPLPIPSPETSANSGGACAACRYQRRRCGDECPLAPYFPAHYHHHFLNCHRFFGVHNIVKTIRSLPPSLRATAVASLIFSAHARALDPVGGCPRIIRLLQAQIADAMAQLCLLRSLLSQAQAQAQSQAQPQFDFLPLYGPSLTGFDSDPDPDPNQDIKFRPMQAQVTVSQPTGLDQHTKSETAANSSLSGP